MMQSFLCPCGCQFEISSEHPGRLFHCPACQRALFLPATTSSGHSTSRVPAAWLILGSALVVGLLVLAGMLVLLFQALNDRPAPPRDVLGTLSKEAPAEAPDLRRTVPPLRHRNAPAPPQPLPTPVVSRTVPAEARVGQPFTLFLTCHGAEGRHITYQYRTKATAPWQTAPGGRVQLARLLPGPLHLELRVVDSRGQPSQVRTERLTPTSEPTRVVQVSRWRAGDQFYQEVVLLRHSTSQALGIPFQDEARFALLSSFHVDKITDEGAVFTQKVEAVRLVQSPTALATGLADLLRQTQGKIFHLTISPDGSVKHFKGDAKGFAVGRLQGADTSRFFMQTALDADSWKELASLTFFQPPIPAPKDGRWSQKLEHDWGPLGRWTGRIAYKAAGPAHGRYDYRLNLTYHPPDKAVPELPFQVEKASFRLLQGSGTIRYDSARGRANEAQEQFHVRGVLAISALGVQGSVEIEEIQTFHVHIFDQVPPAWHRSPTKP